MGNTCLTHADLETNNNTVCEVWLATVVVSSDCGFESRRQTNIHTDRQAGSLQVDRQADRQADR